MRKRVKTINLTRACRYVGFSSISVVGVLGLMMLFPVARQDSYALCTPDNGMEECMAMPMSTEVGVTTSTVISLALDNQAQMEVVPKANGATSYASTKLAVSTNSNDGYAIYLQTGSESGSLTGVTTNLDFEISNTAKNGVTLDNLENNSYGYALSKTVVDSNTRYSHIPTTSTVIESTTSSAMSGGDYAYGDTYYLAFGTKVGTNLPAGQYAGTVTVSAVANPTTLRSMYDLTYMQDMTADICSNTKEHYTKQLIDTRDGKSYWVAKLKDGNCWMTQNLALDLDVNADGNAVAVAKNGSKVELNSNNTDIAGVWSEYTPTRTEIVIPAKIPTHPNAAVSWNFGNVVLTNPTGSTACGNINTGSSIADCQWYRNVDDMIISNNPSFSNATSSADGNIYDAHYLIGNYYQWNTATAGTGIATNTLNTGERGETAKTDPNELVDARDSICPKGWKLPTDGRDDIADIVTAGWPFDREDSFYKLLRAYGYPETGISTDNTGLVALQWISNKGNAYTSIAGDGKTRFDFSPMYLVRSGLVDISAGALRDAGSRGLYWSSTAYPSSTTSAYSFNFYSATVHPSDINVRHSGLPVRCLVR